MFVTVLLCTLGVQLSSLEVVGLVGPQGFPLVGSLYPQGVVSNQGLDQCHQQGLVECHFHCLEY